MLCDADGEAAGAAGGGPAVAGAGERDGTHPVSDVAISVKLTLPVGFVPVTVAVKVTAVPTVAGLPELVSVVVVAVGDTEQIR